MNESAIASLLADRYCAPEWAFLPQVRSRTGYAGNIRTADALAMSLWPSRGVFLHGFEIKSHRSDWLNELKNPAKAEEIASKCDFWWIAAPENVVVEAELPAAWGYIAVKTKDGKSKLVTVKAALRHEKALPMSREFIAAVMRNMADATVPRAHVNDLVEQKWKAEEARVREGAALSLQRTQEDLKQLQKIVQEFEKASGLRLNNWQQNHERLGKTVKWVMENEDGAKYIQRQLLDLERTAQGIAQNLTERLKTFKENIE